MKGGTVCQVNDVNDRRHTPKVASGRMSSKARQIVIKRNPCNLGTWNVRSMLRPGKLANVIKEMRKAHIDIMGLSEVRWKDNGDFLSDGIRIIYTGGSNGEAGVALLIESKLAKNITTIEMIGGRIIMVRITAAPTNIVVIQVYMPTTRYTDDEVEEWYEKIEELLRKVKGTEYLVVMGDWNATVGENKDGEHIGKYGLGKRNERGDRLAEFCKEHKLIITNTWFEHPKRRRYTWKAPGDTARYQIDYIMVRTRFRNSIKNAHTLPGADADTDHNLVIAKTNLSLKRIKKRRQHSTWNMSIWNEHKEQFTKKLEEEFKRANETTNEQRWNTLKETIKKVAEITIGKKKGPTARKPWVNETMLQRMEERRKYKSQHTEEARKEYRRLNNELRRETRKAREKWWTEQCEDIEELQRQGRQDQMYDRIKKLTRKQRGVRTGVKAKNGELLTKNEDIKARWKEYVEELYKEDNDNPTWTRKYINEEEPEIMDSEIELALKCLKTGKAEGIDCVRAEFLKTLGPNTRREMQEICKQIYQDGTWPEDFTKLIMIPLQKKPGATACEDHRTISLISHASKILIHILSKRLENKVDAIRYISEDQFGFRKERGTRDAIATLRTIIERSIEYDQNVYVCFVDFEKAFDRVKWKYLIEILEKIGVDERDIKLIQDLYSKQKAVIRWGEELTAECNTEKGVRQGCPLSPLLFNIYIQQSINELEEMCDDGIIVNGNRVRSVRFADDQAMVANSERGLQRMMTKLNEVTQRLGMKINAKKTKVMCFSKTKQKRVNIRIGEEKLEQVQSFTYLGSMITEDGKCTSEIKRRIAIGKKAFIDRKEIMTGELSLNLRKRLAKIFVWSTLTYGAETWTIRELESKKLEAMELWIWRKMMKIPWISRKTNEEVLEMVNEKRGLLDRINKTQKRWVGHMMRGDSLLREVIEGRMEGKRAAGRPRLKWLDNLCSEGYEKAKRLAQDRWAWHIAPP